MTKGKRKKRTWIITGIICLLGAGLAITAIVLLTTGGDDDDSGDDNGIQAALNLDDFLNGKFVPKSFNATWTSGNEVLYTDVDGNVVIRNLENGTIRVLLDSTDNILITAFDFQLSGDGLYLLVAYNYQKLYRHSYRAHYIIVELSSGSKTNLTVGNPAVQLAVWSPVGSALVYVVENNIYYQTTSTLESTVFNITSSLATGYISNGIPDWVYEEIAVADSTTSPSTSRPSSPSAWSVDTLVLDADLVEPDSTTGPDIPDLSDDSSLDSNGQAYPIPVLWGRDLVSSDQESLADNDGSSSDSDLEREDELDDSDSSEEVFSSNKALWFSPDGKKLAFGRFNDNQTPVMVIPVYGEPGSLSFQYPRANLIKYPKAGTTNPTVSLHVADLTDPSIVTELQIPNILNNEDPILTAVEWATEDVVAAIWMNRVQNSAAIVTYDVSSNPVTSTIVKRLESTSGWLELFTPPIFSKDGSKFVLILSQMQANQDSYRHIVLFNTVENAQEQPLTQGAFVVTEILTWNHDDNLIYYLANTDSDYAVQHLYSVSPDTMEIKCLSCNLKSKHNTSYDCLYNTAEFSRDSSYYALTCAGPDVPQISIYTKGGQEILSWNNNEDLAGLVTSKQVPTFQKLSFDIADGFKANVMLRLPPNIDTSGNTKYPMLVNVYGGPDTYQVIDRFVLDWGSYLAANKSIIYAAIDGRGSGLKGDKILYSGYRHLGTVEVIDQINVTRQIQETLPYVDSARTAIWGWSYGGYAAGMALATDTEGIFKCGISVAPVTDWALYDSIYTERFMGLPTTADNWLGYQAAQLLTKYEGLRDKEYFLIHGTYDDNVHYQQSMLWSKVLEQNDILFRQQSYPDEDHGLGLVRPHLYHSLESFLDECFIDKED